MTMRLIDADALYNGTMKNEYFQFKESDKTGREAFAYSCAMERLVEAPAVDAVPVRHGRWIDRDGQYECSECNNISCCKGKYCTDCGAKMDGDENATD